jgi:hypothetical protein
VKCRKHDWWEDYDRGDVYDLASAKKIGKEINDRENERLPDEVCKLLSIKFEKD